MKNTDTTLYSRCVQCIATNLEKFSFDNLSDYLSNTTKFHLLWEVYLRPDRDAEFSHWRLKRELSNLDVFYSLLSVPGTRPEQHKMFSECNQPRIGGSTPLFNSTHKKYKGELCRTLVEATLELLRTCGSYQKRQVSGAFNFACFLLEAGWFDASEKIFREILNVHRLCDVVEIEVRVKLLNVLTSNAKFDEAEQIFQQLQNTLDSLGVDVDYRPSQRHRSVSTCSSSGMNTDDDESDSLSQASVASLESRLHLSAIFSEFSEYFFDKSQFQESFQWSLRAFRCLHVGMSQRIIIDVLRRASKAFVARRDFKSAELLIVEAVLMASSTYGDKHPKYADTLMDYGFYLLNIDAPKKSVHAYKLALSIREEIFGPSNLIVGLSHSDYAYALYVLEYSTGTSPVAQHHAEKSLSIINEFCDEKHFFNAIPCRVLSLIIEEIAIDPMHKNDSLLDQAEKLQLLSLTLTLATFGENNIQTAKRYGNLGRLYQSMGRYTEAEAMHKKSIVIKEKLLGKFDYETAISIGHLASLYTYELHEYAKGEELYLRSEKVSLKLFGPGYSGLEYDYKGLLRIYEQTRDIQSFYLYYQKLQRWQELERKRREREEHCSRLELPLESLKPLQQVIHEVCANLV